MLDMKKAELSSHFLFQICDSSFLMSVVKKKKKNFIFHKKLEFTKHSHGTKRNKKNEFFNFFKSVEACFLYVKLIQFVASRQFYINFNQ